MKVGNLVKIISCGTYCEIIEIHKEEAHGSGSGHVWVKILDTADEATFCIDEIEVINENR